MASSEQHQSTKTALQVETILALPRNNFGTELTEMRNSPNLTALRHGLSLAAMVFVVAASVRPVWAADGDLDTSFNKNGTQPGVVVNDFNGSGASAAGVAID